jgi:DNA polymerase-3 subunit chi
MSVACLSCPLFQKRYPKISISCRALPHCTQHDPIGGFDMTRIDFYSNASGKHEIARKLASKALHAGSQVFIYTRDKDLARELDAYFWTSQQLSFLPHVPCGHPLADKTPILIGDDPGKMLRPDVLINLDEEIPEWFARFNRLLEIVTTDQQDKEMARRRFRYFKERGYSLNVHDLKAS